MNYPRALTTVRAKMALLLVVALGVATRAAAVGYDDFSTGVGAFDRGDSRLAIEYFTKALADSDLATNFRPTAYLDRGISYWMEGQRLQGEADLKIAEKLDPTDRLVHRALANMSERDGNFDAAALECGKGYLDAAYTCGRLEWEAGHFSEALTRFQNFFERSESVRVYDALWLRIALASAGAPIPRSFETRSANISVEQWPGPILKLYLGQLGEADVRREALDGDPTGKNGRLCEADFYLGERKREQGQTDDAKKDLLAAAGECPDAYIERPAANAALVWLNAGTQENDKSAAAHDRAQN